MLRAHAGGKAGARASCCEKADDCKRLAEASLVGFLAVLWLAVLPKEECSAKPGLRGEPGSARETSAMHSRTQRIACPCIRFNATHLFMLSPYAFPSFAEILEEPRDQLSSAFPSKSNVCVARKTRASDTVWISQPSCMCKDNHCQT